MFGLDSHRTPQTLAREGTIQKMRFSSALFGALVVYTASGRNVPLDTNMRVLNLDVQGEKSSCPPPLISYCCNKLDYSGDQVKCIGTSNSSMTGTTLLNLTYEPQRTGEG
jgi:hypothetical protein